MKNIKKIITVVMLFFTIVFLIWLIFIFVLPKQFVIQPDVIGKVVDIKGNPINNATVYRIIEKEKENSEYGYIEYYNGIIDKQITNNKGIFKFNKIVENRWFVFPIFKPTSNCNLTIRVEKKGFRYKDSQKLNIEFLKQNNKYFHCKCLLFEPIIIMQKVENVKLIKH